MAEEPAEARRLRETCERLGLRLDFVREIQYGRQFRVEKAGEHLTVNVYRGKKGVSFLVQGRASFRDELEEALRGFCGDPSLARIREAAPEPTGPRRGSERGKGAEGGPGPPAETPSVWIGSDESGKGDIFGGLYVAAVRVTRESAERLVRFGSRDCKDLGDARVAELDRRIRACCPARVVFLSPARYNEEHARTRNVNVLLGRLHARAVADLAAAHPGAERAVVDRFGDPRYVLEPLREYGATIPVEFRVRAESDPAVAAASVLARAAFLRGLAALSAKFGIPAAPGAGPPAIEALREFVRLHGREPLGGAAKLHFRSLRILG